MFGGRDFQVYNKFTNEDDGEDIAAKKGKEYEAISEV